MLVFLPGKGGGIDILNSYLELSFAALSFGKVLYRKSSLKLSVKGKFNKTKDWALVQNAALVMKIKVLKLGLVR